MVSKGFPDVVTKGSIGEKPTVILYTSHAGT